MMLTVALGGLVSLGMLGHVPYLQILNAVERVVWADRRGGFVQEVFSGTGKASVNLLDAGLSPLSVDCPDPAYRFKPNLGFKLWRVHVAFLSFGRVYFVPL